MIESVFFFFSLIVCIEDIYKRKIRNLNVLTIFFVSLLLSRNEAGDIVYTLTILVIVATFIFITHLWAGGDCKLLLSLAPLFLPKDLVDLAVSILLLGGVLALFYWLKYRIIYTESLDYGLPYGVAIIGGAHLSLYFSKGLPIYS